MKAYIIHTHHEISVKYANAARNSFKQFGGWDPILFEGLTPVSLPMFLEESDIHQKDPGRAQEYCAKNSKKCRIKQSCSLNHYRLFKLCLELDEPIAIIEHDSHCIGSWTQTEFDDVLVLNVQSALNKQPILQKIKQQNPLPIEQGLKDIDIKGLRYNLIDPALKGQHIMPGTAAYAVTPSGARKMVAVYESLGWDQSDFIINTGYVRIQTLMPELFTFKLPNLSTSHGRNFK